MLLAGEYCNGPRAANAHLKVEHQGEGGLIETKQELSLTTLAMGRVSGLARELLVVQQGPGQVVGALEWCVRRPLLILLSSMLADPLLSSPHSFRSLLPLDGGTCHLRPRLTPSSAPKPPSQTSTFVLPLAARRGIRRLIRCFLGRHVFDRDSRRR